MMDSEGRGESAEQNGFKERVIESYKHALKLATTLYYYGQVKRHLPLLNTDKKGNRTSAIFL